MTERERREREWLAEEVRLAAPLSDSDRIRILRDLLRTVDAISSAKSPQDLLRDEEARRRLDELPARERYRALIERLR